MPPFAKTPSDARLSALRRHESSYPGQRKRETILTERAGAHGHGRRTLRRGRRQGRVGACEWPLAPLWLAAGAITSNSDRRLVAAPNANSYEVLLRELYEWRDQLESDRPVPVARWSGGVPKRLGGPPACAALRHRHDMPPVQLQRTL